jgi:hypothetical protein
VEQNVQMETSTKGFLDQHKDKGMKANRDKWNEKQKKKIKGKTKCF